MRKYKYNDDIVGIVYKEFDGEEVINKIEELEEQYGILLPEDYKTFLIKYNGGETNYLHFGKSGWESSFYGDGIIIERFLSIEEIVDKEYGSYWDVITEQELEFEKLKPVKRYLCFALASGSYKILISCEEEDYGTVYLQDDRNREEFYIEKVVDNFSDFISNLYHEKQEPVEDFIEFIIKKWGVDSPKIQIAKKREEEELSIDYVEIKI